jgi:hypothetical protein
MLPAPTPQRRAAPVSYARMLIRAQRRFHALNGAVPPLEDSLSHLWERVGVRARPDECQRRLDRSPAPTPQPSPAGGRGSALVPA